MSQESISEEIIGDASYNTHEQWYRIGGTLCMVKGKEFTIGRDETRSSYRVRWAIPWSNPPKPDGCATLVYSNLHDSEAACKKWLKN